MRVVATIAVLLCAGLLLILAPWRQDTAEVARSELRADGGTQAPTPAPDEVIEAVEGLLPGSQLNITLSRQPQSHYMAALEEEGADEVFREHLVALGAQADFDPWLTRAAREIAVQGAVLGDSPPEAALSFILRSAGAPEGSVAQLLVQANGEDPSILDDAILGALDGAPQGQGRLLIGLGEAAVDDGPYDRRVVVVVARRNFGLAPTARQLHVNQDWIVEGWAPEHFGDAHASVLYPDNHMEELEVPIEGDGHFEVEIPSGEQEGTIFVSIDGNGVEGPGKLLQLQAEVGRAPPSDFEMRLAPAEEFDSTEAAERYALQLLNRDRATLGLGPLALDPALSDIARAHSEEMRDENYFAHRSPNTGLAADRLARAQYFATGHGENLALNDSIAEAQSSLLESVGHRRNIVTRSMSRVGIGLAQGESTGPQKSWHLTQVFAQPVAPLDPQEARALMLERINAARAQLHAAPVVFDEELNALAQWGAAEALGMELSDVPGLVASRANDIAQARVAVSIHIFYDLASLEPDETSLQPAFESVGMAFVRDPEDLQGKTILLFIAAE